MDLKKANDEMLWEEWGKLITAAAQIKKELDRRQNQPALRVVKSGKLGIKSATHVPGRKFYDAELR